MNKITFCLFFFLLFSVIFGCSNKPAEFPAIYPCRVEVLNGKTPEAGVSVLLYPAFPSGSLLCSGKTDRAGIAMITTALHDYRQSGVPVGEYIVVLEKLPELTDTLSKKELDQMLPFQKMAYNEEQIRRRNKLPKIVPVKLTHPDTSPLKISVAETGTSLTVELTDHVTP